MKNQRTQRLFNWTGSKARVASNLVPLFPEGEKYIEPFVGSGMGYNSEQIVGAIKLRF